MAPDQSDVKSGKPDIEEALREASQKLYKAATVLCPNMQDAEDALQDTLLAACRSYASFRGSSSPTTWMYRILLREAARKRRARAHDPFHPSAADTLASDEKSPFEAAESSDEYRALLAALRMLPPRQGEIATLFYLEGLSYVQLADALGISVGTVKSALSRARTSLREKLEQRAAIKEVPDGLPE